jgi:hypothetical protein
MKSNVIDERERRRLEAEREFEEMMKRPCPVVRPRMVAIQVGMDMARAIQARPESLKLIAEDEGGVVWIERPYAATGGTSVLLSAGRDLDVYAVVRR